MYFQRSDCKSETISAISRLAEMILTCFKKLLTNEDSTRSRLLHGDLLLWFIILYFITAA
jgi:hypothetical protein